MVKRVGLLIDEEPKNETAVYPCPHCGKEYKSEAGLKAHVEKEHPQVFDKD